MMLLFAMACTPAQPEGTAVGNPGKTKMMLAAPTFQEGGTHFFASAQTEAVSWLLSENGVGYSEHPVDTNIDLLDSIYIDTPEGEFSHVELWLSYVELIVESHDGDTIFLWMEDVFLEVERESGFQLVDERYNFEMAKEGWIDAAIAENVLTTELLIDEDHGLYDEIESSLFRTSALYLDMDGDGNLDDHEREKALVAEGTGRTEGDPDNESSGYVDSEEDLTSIPAEVGCQSAVAQSSWQVLGFLLWLVGYRSYFFSKR
jgi:hypothetical protein